MTWSSDSTFVPSSRFPLRPTMLRGTPTGSPGRESDGMGAWLLDELSPIAPNAFHEMPSAGEPTPEEVHAAAEEAREAALANEHARLIADARAEGYAAGEATGRAEEQARLATALATAEKALDQLRAGESYWLEQLEDNVCALAVAVARQVIGRELESDPGTLTDLLRRALSEFPIDQPVSIRVNPLDLALLAASHPADEDPGGTASVAPNRETRWIADPAVLPGGCIVEGRERIIDGRVDAALERIYRRMTGNHA